MSAACYCDYDGDGPEFYHRREVKARRRHGCVECGCTIEKGEAYEVTTGKWEGEVSNIKTCLRCLKLRKWVKAHVPCFCWSHQNLREDCRETIEAYRHECPGLWFGWARQDVAIARRAAADRKARNYGPVTNSAPALSGSTV